MGLKYKSHINKFSVPATMSEDEAKRKRVADLLNAGVGVKKIISIVKVGKTTVYNVRRALKEGKSLESVPKQGQKPKVRTPAFLAKLKAKIKEDPTCSMRRLAIHFKVSEHTIRQAVHEDLNMKSYARTQKHLLTESMKKIETFYVEV